MVRSATVRNIAVGLIAIVQGLCPVAALGGTITLKTTELRTYSTSPNSNEQNSGIVSATPIAQLPVDQRSSVNAANGGFSRASSYALPRPETVAPPKKPGNVPRLDISMPGPAPARQVLNGQRAGGSADGAQLNSAASHPLDPGAKAGGVRKAASEQTRFATKNMWGEQPGFRSPAVASRQALAVTVTANNQTTGMKPWWDYSTTAVKRQGAFATNLVNGNLIVTSTDVLVPHRDIAFDFTRTYNSQSGHNAQDSDGSGQGIYGNGWTSTVDRRLSANNLGGITYHDATGAQWNFTSAGNGTWTSPTGFRAKLQYDGDKGYYLYYPTGHIDWFYSPLANILPANQAALSGKLRQIIGRNHNNFITLQYTFDNNDSTSINNLNTITQVAEDGTRAYLYFNLFGGKRELNYFKRPDGATLGYKYADVSYSDSPGQNLWLVQTAGNNAGSPAAVTYNYYPSSSRMQDLADARQVASAGKDGVDYQFAYDGSNRVTIIRPYSNLNFVPSDGTNTLLQGGQPQGFGLQPVTQFGYVQQAVDGSDGVTTYADGYGHSGQIAFDTKGRRTAKRSNIPSGALTQYTTWDAENNIASSVDVAGGLTSFTYDPAGNIVAVAGPTTTSNNATFRPTKLFSYDSFNNQTVACDENWVHAHNLDWTNGFARRDDLCPKQAGTMQSVYTAPPGSPSYEPYGELTSQTTPVGYTATLQYAVGIQDIGKPIAISGLSITQVDGTTLARKLKYTYDSSGRMLTKSNPIGNVTFTYDANGRLLSSSDSDGAKQSFEYYPDGSVAKTLPEGSTFEYDINGNVVAVNEFFNGEKNTTQTWYDGFNRPVEVKRPYNQADAYKFPWLERNLYDLTNNGQVAFGSPSIAYNAHGNLYKTQKYLSATKWTAIPNDSTPRWIDVNGTSYDELDRDGSTFFYPPGSDNISISDRLYDASTGRLKQIRNALRDTQNFTYDALGRMTNVAFTVANPTYTLISPNRAYRYDAVGNLVAIDTAKDGQQLYGTQSYAYNASNQLTTFQEAGSGTSPVSSPERLTYNYYPDGSVASLDVQSTSLTQSKIKQYVYRDDGLLIKKIGQFAGKQYTWGATYTKAGRILSKYDPYNSPSMLTTYSSQRPEWPIKYALVEGSYFNIEHDAESRVTGYKLQDGADVVFGYSARGELTYESVGGAALFTAKSADGYIYEIQNANMDKPCPTQQIPGIDSNIVGTKVCSSPAWAFDSRSNATIGAGYNVLITSSSGSSNVSNSTNNMNSGNNSTSTSTTGTTATNNSSSTTRTGYIGYTFETAGRRMRNATESISDNENQTRRSVNGKTTAYLWGPDRKLKSTILASQLSGEKTSLHWDGQSFLFATDKDGKILQVNFDDDSIVIPSGGNALTVLDRDVAGAVISSRNSTGSSELVLSDLNAACTDAVNTNRIITPKSPSFSPIFSPCQTNGALFINPNGSGLSDGNMVLGRDNQGYDVESASVITSGGSSNSNGYQRDAIDGRGSSRRLQVDTAFMTGDDYSSGSNFNKSAFGAGDGIINSNSQFGEPTSAFGKSHLGQYYVPYSGPPEPDECTSFKGMCQIGGVHSGVWKNLNNTFGENPSSKSGTTAPDNSYMHYAVGFGMILSGSYNVYRFHDSPTVVQSIGYGGGYSYAGVAPVDVSVSIGHIYGPDNQPIVGEARADFLRGFGAGGTLIVGAGGSWSGNSSGHAYEVGVGNPQISTGFSYGW